MLIRPEINSEVLKNFIIPPRPEALVAVSQEARSDDPDLSVIVKAISGDVSLSGALLQVVNSPFYGLRSKVSSVQQAAGLLGINKIDKLVTSVSLRSQLGSEMDLGRFWDSATEIANLSGLLAAKLVGVDNDEAYMLGLFHDCGIPVLMQHFSDYKETLKECNDTDIRPVTNIEFAKYEVHHALLGYKLAKDWFLSETMCDAILFHHDCLSIFQDSMDREGPVISLLAVLKLAEQISFEIRRELRADSHTDWDIYGPIIINYFGLTAADIEEMKDDMKEKLELF